VVITDITVPQEQTLADPAAIGIVQHPSVCHRDLLAGQPRHAIEFQRSTPTAATGSERPAR